MDAIRRLTPADEERSGTGRLADRRDDRNGRTVPLKHRPARIHLPEDIRRQPEKRRGERQTERR